MVYANDQWIQLPTRDLYDTQVMAMAINAARDMYEKGQQEMKDFQKTYGDFLTPIMADQDWYNQNVTGRVRDAVNALYAQGIDPLRNAEGRAMISQLINNMPYGDIAKLRTSAENAKEYLKNKAALEAQGKYSADLEERFLGYDISNWDTTKNGAWNRVSPTQMKSLKELTEQLYNSRTARDLTEEDLRAAGIPYDKRYQYSGYLDSDILNTAKGFTPGWNDSVYSEYYRDLAKKQLQIQGVKDPTAAQVEATLQRNIADANQEWLINPTKKADEFAILAQKHQDEMELQRMRERAAARAAARSAQQPQQSNQWSFAEVVRRNAVTSALGQQIQEYGPQSLAKIRDEQIRFGKSVSDKTGGHSFKYAGTAAYKQKFGQNTYSENDIANFLGYDIVDGRTKTMVIPKSQIDRLHDFNDVMSHTTGFRGRMVGTNNNDLKGADFITIVPTRGSYGSYTKRNRFENYFEFEVQGYKNQEVTEIVNGKETKTIKQVPVGQKKIKYLDTHITSNPDAPGTGYLGTRTSSGAVADTPNIPVTNTQDYRYQDAISGDKIATDQIIKGTIYGSDAIPTELPAFPYNYAYE